MIKKHANLRFQHYKQAELVSLAMYIVEASLKTLGEYVNHVADGDEAKLEKSGIPKQFLYLLCKNVCNVFLSGVFEQFKFNLFNPMIRYFRLGLFFVFFVFFVSCESVAPKNGNSGGSEGENTVDYTGINQFMLDKLRDVYLWSSSISSSQTVKNISPKEFLSSVVPANDRYSFVIEWQKWQDLINGSTTGHGFSSGFFNDLNGKSLYVVLVYPNSLAEKSGMKRGDKIVLINGKNPAELENVSGELAINSTNRFVLERPDLSRITLDIGKSSFQVPSVFFKTVLTESKTRKKVGYLLYNTFLNMSDGQLESAFKYFQSTGVDDLIIDLRYNGGGYVSEAVKFGSLIVPSRFSQGKSVFVKMVYNEKHTSENEVDYLVSRETLGLSRVFILTSEASASASELLLNGLKPYISVFQIGTTTYGKPVGSNSYYYKNEYSFFPVTFAYQNAAGQGDFFTGINPDYVVAQPVPFMNIGDESEALIAPALYYIGNGRFPNIVTHLQENQTIELRQLNARLFRNEFEKMRGTF